MAGDALSVLCRADASLLTEHAERLLPELQALGLEVLQNRTALSMLPMHDTARGVNFYLGEVLLAEAHVRVGGPQGQEGYAAVLGRDLVKALAAAVLDAAGRLPQFGGQVAALVEAERKRQEEEDDLTLREIEATRVEMETF